MKQTLKQTLKLMKLRHIAATLGLAVLLVGCAPQAPTPAQPSPAAPTVAPPTVAPPTVAPPTVAPATPETPLEAPTPTAPVEPHAELPGAPPTFADSGMAVVENVDVRILESFPVQVQAVVTGYLPDGCTTLTGAEAVNEGTTFRVRLTTDRPADTMCTMQIVAFEQVVPLQTAELPAGSYQVAINDLGMTFELPSSEAPSVPSTEEGQSPVVETETEYIMANVDVPMVDAPAADANEIGLIAGGQMARVTGASEDGAWWRVICPDDSIGDCWVSAAPDLTAPATPPN